MPRVRVDWADRPDEALGTAFGRGRTNAGRAIRGGGGNFALAQEYPHLADYAKIAQGAGGNDADVIWHGGLSRERVAEILKQSQGLCCTSVYEGFPNTFLEAWCHGRPVISSFDPDGLIASRGLGTYAMNVERFTAGIRTVLKGTRRRSAWWRIAGNISSSTHSKEMALPRFEAEFLRVLKGDVAAMRWAL